MARGGARRPCVQRRWARYPFAQSEPAHLARKTGRRARAARLDAEYRGPPAQSAACASDVRPRRVDRDARGHGLGGNALATGKPRMDRGAIESADDGARRAAHADTGRGSTRDRRRATGPAHAGYATRTPALGGRAQGLEIARLLQIQERLTGKKPELNTTLVLDGHWDFALSESAATGAIQLEHRLGDVQLHQAPAGFSALSARLDLSNQKQASLSVHAQAARL